MLSGSDTGNASAFSHGKWHGKEAELFLKEVGMQISGGRLIFGVGRSAFPRAYDAYGISTAIERIVSRREVG